MTSDREIRYWNAPIPARIVLTQVPVTLSANASIIKAIRLINVWQSMKEAMPAKRIANLRDSIAVGFDRNRPCFTMLGDHPSFDRYLKINGANL